MRWRARALFIDLDIFGPGADHRRIIDGLRATTARIIADRANLGSPAGETALVTLYAQLAMLGPADRPRRPRRPATGRPSRRCGAVTCHQPAGLLGRSAARRISAAIRHTGRDLRPRRHPGPGRRGTGQRGGWTAAVAAPAGARWHGASRPGRGRGGRGRGGGPARRRAPHR